MVSTLQLALTINFVLDAIVAVFLLYGHELSKEIVTHPVFHAQCGDLPVQDPYFGSPAWPGLEQSSCGGFLRVRLWPAFRVGLVERACMQV